MLTQTHYACADRQSVPARSQTPELMVDVGLCVLKGQRKISPERAFSLLTFISPLPLFSPLSPPLSSDFFSVESWEFDIGAKLFS